jgi:Leucine-rich repeat (LRR) protein
MLPELEMLDLENNQLPSIDENLLKFNPKLKNISFKSNRVRSISPTVFKHLRKLVSVDLTENDCISSFFTQTSLGLMYSEIEEKCASCEILKTQLATCRRQKSVSLKAMPKTFDNLKKENDKLKLLLKVNFDFNF